MSATWTSWVTDTATATAVLPDPNVIAEIRAHLQEIEAKPAVEQAPCFTDKVLQQIYDKLPVEFDFRDKAGGKPEEKVSQKSYVVLV